MNATNDLDRLSTIQSAARARCALSRFAGAILACATILAFAVSDGAAAGDDPAFAVYKLSVADKVLYYWVEDLDGDELKDIVVVHRKGLPPVETRWISVFWNDASNGFSTAADQSWELDRDAVILDIGDVAGDSRKEICYLTPTDVRYHIVESGRFRATSDTLFEVSGLGVFPSKRGAPLINFVRDWNDDYVDEVGVFTFDGLSIHARGGDGVFAANGTVRVELETEMSRSGSRAQDEKTSGLQAEYVFPDLSLLDFDGDGRRDLFATTDDRVTVYKCGADGRFNAEAHSKVEFDVLTQEEKLEGFAEVETVVADLNADGYADAVVTKQTAKGLTNFRGVVNVFWGGPAGYRKEPDQVIISEGTASARALFKDVNGDGLKDLILPSITFNIAAIIRILITRSIGVNFNIFLLNEDNRLSERPDFTKEVKFKIDFSGESDEQAMDLEGDYNGDKRTDFVFATKEDELSVYLGVTDGDRLFSKNPATKVAADAYGDLNSHDLNNDGYSDMVIHYPQSKDRKGTLEVLMNLKTLR